MDQIHETGAEVAPGEELYRFVTVPSFWVASENRPSSSLFDDPPRVSVNVASLTTIEECRAQLIDDLNSPNGGMVSFNCGQARALGFNAKHEPEQGNPAHAHLYCDATARRKDRKKNAQKLARLCAIVIPPRF